MQADILARNESLHSAHPYTPLNHDKKPSDAAKHARDASLHPELLKTAKDTLSNSSVKITEAEASHETRNHPPAHPGPGAQRAELLEYINQQLDCFGKEPLLMDRYQLLGPNQRASGGAFPI
jgi:hypothetical protein